MLPCTLFMYIKCIWNTCTCILNTSTFIKFWKHSLYFVSHFGDTVHDDLPVLCSLDIPPSEEPLSSPDEPFLDATPTGTPTEPTAPPVVEELSEAERNELERELDEVEYCQSYLKSLLENQSNTSLQNFSLWFMGTAYFFFCLSSDQQWHSSVTGDPEFEGDQTEGD